MYGACPCIVRTRIFGWQKMKNKKTIHMDKYGRLVTGVQVSLHLWHVGSIATPPPPKKKESPGRLRNFDHANLKFLNIPDSFSAYLKEIRFLIKDEFWDSKEPFRSAISNQITRNSQLPG